MRFTVFFGGEPRRGAVDRRIRSTTLLVWAGVFLLVGMLGCSTTEPVADEQPAEEVEEAMPARPFFVQVASAEQRADAEAVWQQVVTWWNQTDAPPDPLRRYGDAPVHIVWQTPLYRVRVGPVATREEANAVLSMLADQFDGAFIARGTP